jgi:predicted metal-binding transcription factor (methanogenesis marker protein 9)
MKSNANKIMVDDYYGLLRNLSKETKIKLIAKLSNSIIEDNTSENENVVDNFFGAFKSNKSAEEIIKEIRESRTFNRTIEVF